jgi:hypothetical protein
MEIAMMHASHAAQVRGFRIHALVFVLTMILLAAINFATGEPYWVLWTLLGWGIGLIAHWAFVLGPARDQSSPN